LFSFFGLKSPEKVGIPEGEPHLAQIILSDPEPFLTQMGTDLHRQVGHQQNAHLIYARSEQARLMLAGGDQGGVLIGLWELQIGRSYRSFGFPLRALAT
jgi:hypothetical protein